MGNRAAVRHLVDLLMTVVLVLLMAYFLTDQEIHEWLGAGMLVLFIVHHILNRKWLKALNRGKYTPFRVLQTALVLLVLLCMLGSMLSGIWMSQYIFDFLPTQGHMGLARDGASAVRLLGLSPAVGSPGPPLGDHAGRGAEGNREQETVCPPHCGPPGADRRELRLWCVRLFQAPHCRLSLFTKPLCIL